MNKLFMVLGLFLSTQLIAGNSCENTDIFQVKDLISKGSSDRSFLYAYTLDGDSYTEAPSVSSTYQNYIPYCYIGEEKRIVQVDDVTFQVHNKGHFLCSYTVGITAADAVFALEVTDSTGSYLIDGSDIPFNSSDSVSYPYKSLTFLFELHEKHSLIRIANTYNTSINIKANQETGVGAGLTILQIH